MAEEIAGWLASGLQGVKVGFGKRGNARLGYEHDRDVAFVKAVREAIGPRKPIMIDLGWAIKWDVTTAVERTLAMEEYEIAWIESRSVPGTPTATRPARQDHDPDGLRREGVEPGRFQRILDTGTVDVVGVDPGRARASPASRRSPSESRRIDGRRTPTPGRRRSSARRAWPSRSAARRASSSSSSRCETRCSTSSSPGRSSSRTGGHFRRPARVWHRRHRGGGRPLSEREGARRCRIGQ